MLEERMSEDDKLQLRWYEAYIAQFEDIEIYLCPDCGHKDWWLLKKNYTVIVRCKCCNHKMVIVEDDWLAWLIKKGCCLDTPKQ